MKKKIMGLFCGFVAFMLIFTVLSRAADSVSVAQVVTQRSEKGKIDHVVSATGKVVQNREQAVSTEPLQVVKTIYVEEGQQVQEGDLLFEVDLEELQEEILNRKQEMQKEDLSAEDRASARDAKAYQRAVAQGRAAEDYSVAAGKGDTAVSRAYRELQEAKKQLRAFNKAAASGNGSADAVTGVLQLMILEKQTAYEEAVQEKKLLEREIDEVVKKALEDAQKGTLLSSVEIPAETALMAAQAGGDAFLAEGGEELTFPEDAGASGNIPEAEPDPILSPEADAVMLPQPETDPILTPETDPGLPSQPDPMLPPQSESVMPSETEPSPPSQAELDLLERRIRQQNQALLDEADKRIALCKKEKEQAEEALSEHLTNRAAQNQSSIQSSRRQLQEAVRLKQQAYQDAVTAKNDGLRAAGRAIEDASAPEGTDSTGEIDAISREQRELELSKLERLMEAEGKIYAPISGLITRINLITGERTPDGTAIMMADTSGGSKLEVQIPASQEAYIGRGDAVTLKKSGEKESVEGMTVESVTQDEENEELLKVTVKLPADFAELGTMWELTCTKSSEVYDMCLPIQCIREANNQYFVYVMEERQSILGSETIARKIPVTIKDKNEKMAAIASGALTSQMEVIADSDKYVEEGSRVRLQEL